MKFFFFCLFFSDCLLCSVIFLYEFQTEILPVLIALIFNLSRLREVRPFSELYQGLSSGLTVTFFGGNASLNHFKKNIIKR